MNKRDITLSVVRGHAVADALGVPVEFETREDLRHDPVPFLKNTFDKKITSALYGAGVILLSAMPSWVSCA